MLGHLGIHNFPYVKNQIFCINYFFGGFVLKKSTSWTVLIYGVITIILGILGYLSGSTISLMAGALSGVLIIISSYFMFSHKQWGAYVATGLTFLLTLTFSVRYTLTHKPLAAILAVLSGGMLLFLLARIAKWKREI